MTDKIKSSIILDHGTLTTRAGFSDSENPLLFPSQTKSMKYPICAGVVKDFTAMEELWHECFDAMGANPQEHRVLLTEPLSNNVKNRESTLEIMFETFKVPAMQSVSSSVLALFNSGRINGIVFTSGSTAGTTYVVPVQDGHAVPVNCSYLPIGGDTFDNALKKMLANRYDSILNASDGTIRQIKENSCYVAQDFANEMASPETTEYTLPDGKKIKLGNERIRCSEGFFKPSLLDVDCEGIHTLIYNTIMKSDETLRKSLFASIVLDGGSTKFLGIVQRLQKELQNLQTSNTNVKVFGSPRWTEGAWRGGCLLANLATFNNWITRSEYSEFGHGILDKKSY